MGWPFGPIVRLLLLTAQRRDEVAGMGWSEISDDGATWTVPAKRSKNGKANVVHLSPEARAVIADVPRIKGQDMLFTTTGRTAPSGFGRAAERLDALIQKERDEAATATEEDAPPPLPDWHLHDFRRTCVSWLASTGTPPHVADRLLNHTAGTIRGVAAVYNRAEFLPERKAALVRWAEHVLACGGGREQGVNVVPLRAGTGR
jgi:integrase